MTRLFVASAATGAALTACVAAYGLHNPVRVSAATDRAAAAVLLLVGAVVGRYETVRFGR